MFANNNNGYSLSDLAAVTGNGDRNNGMFGDEGGAWWIIILFLFCFAGWGGNGGLFGCGNSTGSGITDGYILTSDFASLERQIENGFDRIINQGVQTSNGICSLGYDQLAQINGINNNINTATNTIAAQLTALGTQQAQCCCDTKYQLASSFADLNYRLAEQSCQTRQTINDASQAITLNQDNNTRSILGAIESMKTQALQDKIAELTAINSDLRFQASQAAQNAYLVSALNPQPTPSYTVPNPYTGQYGYRACASCGATAI